jgi:hypothetical protein
LVKEAPTGDIYDPAAWEDIEPIARGIGDLFKFDTLGQTLIGLYQGVVTLDTDEGEKPYLQFKDAMINGEKVGLVAVSASYDLNSKLTDISTDSPVFIRYVADRETSRGQTPMKVYEVKAKF